MIGELAASLLVAAPGRSAPFALRLRDAAWSGVPATVSSRQYLHPSQAAKKRNAPNGLISNVPILSASLGARLNLLAPVVCNGLNLGNGGGLSLASDISGIEVDPDAVLGLRGERVVEDASKEVGEKEVCRLNPLA